MDIDARRGSFEELETARHLAPRVREARPHIQSSSELPPALIDALTGRGLFRLLLPRSLGGSELTLPRFLRCVEVIAHADGSTGWCVGQGGVFPNLADHMEAATAEAIWGVNPKAVVATGTPFGSSAVHTGEGFRVTGRWRFASGCLHATWLAAMAPIVDESGTAIGFGMFLIPRDEVPVSENWNVRGLRGTGSHEYFLSEHPVPRARALLGSVLRDHCGPATGLPAQLLFASAFGTVGLGIARDALDSLAELIAGKTPAFTNRKLIDDDLVHAGLGEAEAIWGASRAFLFEMAEACAHAHQTSGPPPAELRVRLRLAATHAMRESGRVVDKAYELSGSDAIFEDHPVHRCFQDVRALTQQIQARPGHYRTVGRVLLGLEPDNPMV